jgi:hypothetical protein
MAMEVVDSRPLHEHAVPIVMLVMALTIVSAACYGYYANASSNAGAGIGKALVSQVVHVRASHSKNGVAEVTVGDDKTAPSLSSASDAGRVTDLSYSLNNQ